MQRVTERRTRVDRLAAMVIAGAWAVGCATAPADLEHRERVDQTVAGILSEPLPADAYQTSRRCISRASIRDFEVLSDRHLLFEAPRGTFWLNELRGRCPGVNRHRTLVFEAHGMQLCDMDQFTVTDLWHWPRYQRWPWRWVDGLRCSLGRFQPVTETQADTLREALRAR
jgi:hypothetical protein